MCLVTSASFAAPTTFIQFLKDTEIPVEIQQKMAQEIAQRCPTVTQAGEVKTVVDSVQVDQGVVDVYFLTEFTARALVNTEIKTVKILVQAVEWSGSHPDMEKFEIRYLSSGGNSVCE